MGRSGTIDAICAYVDYYNRMHMDGTFYTNHTVERDSLQLTYMYRDREGKRAYVVSEIDGMELARYAYTTALMDRMQMLMGTMIEQAHGLRPMDLFKGYTQKKNPTPLPAEWGEESP